MLQGDKSNSPGLSFLMIAKLCLLIIRTNPYIKKIICSTYSHVFLDEFQDTTKLQYCIVKELFVNTNVKITAVGDNKQRIMFWAGASKTIFEDFIKDFSTLKFQLIMNYRSAPRLVDLQKNMYSVLKDDTVEVHCSNKWQPNDGTVQLVISENEKSEANKIAEMICGDIKLGVSPNKIAIICKQKVGEYTVDIIKALSERGIRARIETEYQELLKDELIRIYLDFLILAINKKNPNSFKNIVSFYILISPEKFSSREQYVCTLKRLDEFINSIRISLLEIDALDKIEDILNHIVNYCGNEKIKSIFPQYNQGTYFDEQTKKFSKLLWEEYEQANKSWEDTISGFVGENSIPILTIHKSKGLEYSNVYFLGLEDSAFWNFKKQPEEDRCAFFVALSRAKNKITFTFSKNRNNSNQKKDDINEFYVLLKECAKLIVAEG